MFAGGELRLYDLRTKEYIILKVTLPGYGEYLKIAPFARQLSLITDGIIEAAWRRLKWDDQQCTSDGLHVNEDKRVIYKNGKRYKQAQGD